MLSRWFSPRSLMLHLALVVWVGGCAIAAWWQVGRAIGGNAYSYFYSVEWPAFAFAGMFCWWAVLHADPEERARRAERNEREETERAASHAEKRDRAAEDGALAAYNDHLERLASSGKRKEWRR